MYSLFWFRTKSYMNPDSTVHIQVNLGIADLTRSIIFDFLFRLALFYSSDLEQFFGNFTMSSIAAVSMDPVEFSMISYFSGLWNNR